MYKLPNNNPFLYHNSAESNSKTYTVIKLATPVLDESQFTADPPVIYWSSIQYASGYDIYLNNVLVMTNHSSLNYNFTNDLPDFPDVYDFAGKIKAIVANQVQYANPKYLDSEFSNIITWGLLPTPIISMNTAEGYDNRNRLNLSRKSALPKPVTKEKEDKEEKKEKKLFKKSKKEEK